RNIDDVTVVSGQPVEQKGFSGWMNRKMQEAQQNAEARQQAMKEQKGGGKGGSSKASASKAVTTDSDGDVIDVESTPKPAPRGTSYQDRVDAATKFKAKPGATATTGNGATPAGSDPNPNSKASKKARRAKGSTS